jgi:hypothetical protein
MWADFGVLTSELGVERITLDPGEPKEFTTLWPYEQQRNDASRYYGSHLRVGADRGTNPVRLRVRGWPADLLKVIGDVTVQPGSTPEFRADLVEVHGLPG